MYHVHGLNDVSDASDFEATSASFLQDLTRWLVIHRHYHDEIFSALIRFLVDLTSFPSFDIILVAHTATLIMV
jgi:hypothetical protein